MSRLIVAALVTCLLVGCGNIDPPKDLPFYQGKTKVMLFKYKGDDTQLHNLTSDGWRVGSNYISLYDHVWLVLLKDPK